MEAEKNKEFPDHNTVLLKCQTDAFQYALRTKSGQEFEFESGVVSDDGEWLRINTITKIDEITPASTQRFERGIDIRISEIEWMADAPHGS